MTSGLFRRKIACFYCGKQTFKNPRRDGRTTVFQCEHCESVNRFDENGDIMDYVPSPPPSPPRSPALRPVSPDEFSAPAFCAHCQKNQQIILNTLSEYLPPEDDPSYERYLANYPAYKAQLEERFPTVCSECEGLVSETIHKANYKAKTRGLAQFLAKSEEGRLKYRRKENWGWAKRVGDFVWACRGAGWWAANAAILCWHVVGAIYTNDQLEMALYEKSWATCLVASSKKSYPDLTCYGVVVEFLWMFLPVSLLFHGWNYRALEERRHPKATLGGHAEYLMWEGAVFLLRLLSWWLLLPQGAAWDISPSTFSTIHIALFAINLITLPIRLTRLKLIEPPKISLRDSSFHAATSPLATPTRPRSADPSFAPVPDNDWSSFHTALPQISPVRRRERPTTPTRSSQFLNSGLGGIQRGVSPLRQHAQQQQESLPKPEYDPDEMDWKPTMATPSRPRPESSWQQQQQQTPRNRAPLQQPTLFAGRPIPNLQPRTPASANPFDSPIDSPASRRFPGSPFSTASSVYGGVGDGSPMRRTTPRGAQGLGAPSGNTLFAPARFFPKEDTEPTGLESLFESTVKIVDDQAAGIPTIGAGHSAAGTIWGERISGFGRPEFSAAVVSLRCLLLVTVNILFAFSTAQTHPILPQSPAQPLLRTLSLFIALATTLQKLYFKHQANKTWDMETILPASESGILLLLNVVYASGLGSGKVEIAARASLLWILGRELLDGISVLQVVTSQQAAKSKTAASGIGAAVGTLPANVLEDRRPTSSGSTGTVTSPQAFPKPTSTTTGLGFGGLSLGGGGGGGSSGGGGGGFGQSLSQSQSQGGVTQRQTRSQTQRNNANAMNSSFGRPTLFSELPSATRDSPAGGGRRRKPGTGSGGLPGVKSRNFVF